MIAEDRPCRFCGYNLRGQQSDGMCPECGKSVRHPRYAAQFSDQMSNAPVAWLRGYQLGTLLLCLGAWVMTPSVAGWLVFGQVWFGAVALIGAGAWITGTIVATRPRPRTLATMIDPETEWRVPRVLARWSQLAWVLALGAGVLVQTLGLVNVLTQSVVTILALTGVVGWWPLLKVQSNLAYWAADTDLSNKLRNSAWAVAPAVGVGWGMLIFTGSGWSGFLIGKVMVYFFWVGLIVVALGYLLITLTQLWRMGHWAMVNQLTRELKDERLREQVRRAALRRSDAR